MDEGAEPVFVIGGPDGLAKSVKERGNVSLSLSSLTYVHSMVPLIWQNSSIEHGLLLIISLIIVHEFMFFS